MVWMPLVLMCVCSNAQNNYGDDYKSSFDLGALVLLQACPLVQLSGIPQSGGFRRFWV